MLDVVFPAAGLLEGLDVVESEHKQNTIEWFQVALSQFGETFLASSVPDLYLDWCVHKVDVVRVQIHSDC